jgi:hypothetical protein
MTLILSGTNGLSDVDGDASTPAVRGTDANTGIFFPAADTIAFAEGGAEAMRINASGNVGIGTTNPTVKFQVEGTVPEVSFVSYSGANNYGVTHRFRTAKGSLASPTVVVNGGEILTLIGQGYNGSAFSTAASIRMLVDGTPGVGDMPGRIGFFTTPDGSAVDAERMRITSGGVLLVGKTTTAIGTAGFVAGANDVGSVKPGALVVTVDSEDCIYINRLTNDGNLISFRQDGSQEGTISVSGTTVSYNGGNLSRWAQLTTPKDDTPLFKGTVMSNLDEMNVYVKPTLYWTEDDELPVDEEGNPTVAVGDVKEETSVSDNEQLNKVKVSDVEGDPNVAGVFVNWTYDEAHQVDEINMAMTGDMIIRIAEGVTVSRGDLLMSAGDGTAKVQGDDIVRSKTIAKVTSTHVTCTYEDGSYCVPCVLMAC